MSTRSDEWVHGFVLKTHDIGEADVLVTWFTEELGKVRGVVTGGRRLTSRLLAGIRSGVMTELRLVSRDGHGLYKLAGVRLLSAQMDTDDASRNVLLQWFLEVILRSLPDAQKNEAVFVLAEEFLSELDKLVEENLWSQFLILVLNNLLTALGVAVHMPSMGIVPKYFSVSRGGFFETGGQRDGQTVDLEIYSRYVSLRGKNIASGLNLPSDERVDWLLCLWLHQFLEYHIDRKIRSFEFVNAIIKHVNI